LIEAGSKGLGASHWTIKEGADPPEASESHSFQSSSDQSDPKEKP